MQLISINVEEILLNHKYDYCVFNVMDDPKEFNINMEIREGLCNIESDYFFPLRGNGWYYQSASPARDARPL